MPDITVEEAGEIMSDMGIVEAAEKLALAMQASMPDAEPTANPQQAGAARNGRGKNSKSSSSRSGTTPPNSGA
jgi:hypothetical protein